MKRIINIFSLLVSLSVLAACGGGTSNQPSGSPPGAGKAADATGEVSRPAPYQKTYLDIRLVDPCKTKACPSPEPETEEDRRYSLPPQK